MFLPLTSPPRSRPGPQPAGSTPAFQPSLNPETRASIFPLSHICPRPSLPFSGSGPKLQSSHPPDAEGASEALRQQCRGASAFPGPPKLLPLPPKGLPTPRLQVAIGCLQHEVIAPFTQYDREIVSLGPNHHMGIPPPYPYRRVRWQWRLAQRRLEEPPWRSSERSVGVASHMYRCAQ
jgi:hypothetical protein